MTEAKVYTAISELTDELRQHGIEKAKKSQGGQFNYAYRGIEDVYAALAPLLPKHHIVIAPVRIEKEPDSTAGKMRLVRIKVSYQITSTAATSASSLSAKEQTPATKPQAKQ